MKLEEARAVLRPRGSWEAVDLGCALARNHWSRLMRGWLTVALPLWALIILIFHEFPVWALFFVAWTKPVLTRQPVFFMSRALFGQAPGAGEFWKNWRTNFRGILAALTFKRLTLQRPFRLPVIMLEGQSGAAYGQRTAVLSAHGGGAAGGLTMVAGLLELCVWGAMGLLIFSIGRTLNPEWLESLRFMRPENIELPESLLWSLVAAQIGATIVIEPFYGAAGFALYFNSRTHLEGWDIEVAFRRMSARLAPAAVMIGAILFLFAAGGSPAAAQEAEVSDPGERGPKEVVQEILKSPAFELEKVKTRIPIEEEEKEKDKPAEDKEKGERETRTVFDPSVFPRGGGGLPIGFLGYAIIAAVIFLVVWLIWKNRDGLRGRGRAGDGQKRTGPRVVMGMDLTPESLPDDIPQVAWREYMAGRPLEALRLLYRGSLAWLVDRAGIPVHESDTEGDCLRHSEHVPDPQRVSFFTALTAAWVNCAYAGLPPAADPMKRLCDHWPFSLRQSRSPSPPNTPAASSSSSSAASASAWLVLPLAALLLSGCKKVEYEIREEVSGYKGEARMNPWLAAERFLTKMGTPAETRLALGDMPAWDATLFIPLDAVASRGEAHSMLRWAMNGGHLIIACTGTGRYHNDYDGVEDSKLDKEAPLLKELNITRAESKPGDTSKIKFGRTSYRFESYDDAALDVYWRSPDVLAGDRRSATIASFDHGMGRITLLAGATPFRNRHLVEKDHAAILENIIALQPSSHVIFVNKGAITLWDMLKRYAWMPLIATILLIVFWLWRHLPRFGMAVPANESGIRHFGTQLDEAGRFLSDRAGAGALLAAARRAVFQAAAQRGLHQEAPDFMDQLAARSGLTHAEVSTALLDSTDKNLTAATAALQKLQQSIGPLH